MLGSQMNRSKVDKYFKICHYEVFDEIVLAFLEGIQRIKILMLETRGLQFKPKNKIHVGSGLHSEIVL